MAAPLYSQAEVVEMISVGKTLEIEMWDEASRNREGGAGSAVVEVASDDPRYRFRVEFNKFPRLQHYHLILRALMHGRDWEGIVRYDIQDNEHSNPPWFPPEVIGVGVPHRHVYSERAVREDLRWDACAEPTPLPLPTVDHLIGGFLVFTNIRFADTAAHQALFDWMNNARV